MKKVLVIVLAVVMAFAFAGFAFAGDNPLRATEKKEHGDQWQVDHKANPTGETEETESLRSGVDDPFFLHRIETRFCGAGVRVLSDSAILFHNRLLSSSPVSHGSVC